MFAQLRTNYIREVFCSSRTGFAKEKFAPLRRAFQPLCRVVADSAGRQSSQTASVASGSLASCNLTHPARSQRYSLHLTFNGQDVLGRAFTLTAFAPAPTATATFTNSGQCTPGL